MPSPGIIRTESFAQRDDAGMAKILVVEDDMDMAYMIADVLGFEHHTVECVTDGQEGLDRLKLYKYDIALVDWNLPSLNGPEMCQMYRASGDTIPILMLTGRLDVSEKQVGLDAGADDYLTKPFHQVELTARVRALLRRASRVMTSNVLQVRYLTLDTESFKVCLDDKEVRLLPKEFSLLEFLMRHKNQVFSVDALLDHVWKAESESTPDALRQCLARLRKKIDRDEHPPIIKTIIGRGYTIED